MHPEVQRMRFMVTHGLCPVAKWVSVCSNLITIHRQNQGPVVPCPCLAEGDEPHMSHCSLDHSTQHGPSLSLGWCPMGPASLHHHRQTLRWGISNLAWLTSLVCSWEVHSKKELDFWWISSLGAEDFKTSQLIKSQTWAIPKELVAKWSAETSHSF